MTEVVIIEQSAITVVEVASGFEIIEAELPTLEIVEIVQQGEKGISGLTSFRVNFTNQQTVQINHALNFYPKPMVFNTNDELILVSPKHINQNRFDLIFNEPISGYVIY